MKKFIISALLILIFGFNLNICVSAIGIDRLPAENEADEIAVLSEKVTVNANLDIDENEILKIPKGKRLSLKKGKTLSVEGVLFIENGGSLLIEKGRLKIGENGAVISNGSLSIGKKSEIVMQSGGILVCFEKSKLTLNGNFLAEDINNFTAVCLGSYNGSCREIGTESLAAVSFKEASWQAENSYDYKVYNREEALEAVPSEPDLSENQKSAAGALYEHLNIFFNNGQVLTLLFRGNDITSAEEIVLLNGSELVI